MGICLNDQSASFIDTLSLHDALPIFEWVAVRQPRCPFLVGAKQIAMAVEGHADGEANAGAENLAVLEVRRDFQNGDRKSTRLNSSHLGISYAVFCLKKKKIKKESEHR